MIETLYPGIYLQEIPGEQPIEGASVSVGAFVGVARKGPIGESLEVSSWQEFLELYGSYMDDSYLAYAVRGFFENGGSRAYISRVVKFRDGVIQASSATVEIKESEEVFAVVDAKTEGIHGNSLSVKFENVAEEGNTFDLVVLNHKEEAERYSGVTLDTIEDNLNPESKLVKISILDDAVVVTEKEYKLSGGTDGIEGIETADYLGDVELKTGLHSFDNIGVNLVAIPGVTDVAVLQGIVTYVENRQDCFAILEAPLGKTPNTVKEFKTEEARLSSIRAAFYYSWIKVNDPIGVGKNPTKTIPPSGHIAGIYARIDNTRGVFKAPAGAEANIRGAIGLEYNVTDVEQGHLNPVGINAIRAFPGEGIVLWGARTTSSNVEYRYVSVRRAVDYVEQSILNSTRWALFETNDEVLWSKITSNSESFLRGFWTAGGLKGASEDEAFYVQCNAETTSQDNIDAGQLFANIGLAAQKPAEFIVFRVSLLK